MKYFAKSIINTILMVTAWAVAFSNCANAQSSFPQYSSAGSVYVKQEVPIASDVISKSETGILPTTSVAGGEVAIPSALQAADAGVVGSGQGGVWEGDVGSDVDCGQKTCRSFLFTWQCQDCDDLKLDLCDPLVTDRPDFTEASSTVGRGVLQLETGYTYIYDGGGNGNPTHQHAHPELLLRAGLFRDWFEMRIGYVASSVINSGVTNSGSEDLYVGAKIGLTPQYGLLPEMSVIPQGTVDTGSPSLTNGTSLFGTNLVYSWQLDDRYSLAGSTQFNRALDEVTNDEYTRWAQSVALGKSLSERFGAYMEWYGFFPDDADTDRVENYLNGGFTYLITNNLQWDIRAGFGLNDSADDFFTGTGLSMRFR